MSICKEFDQVLGILCVGGLGPAAMSTSLDDVRRVVATFDKYHIRPDVKEFLKVTTDLPSDTTIVLGRTWIETEQGLRIQLAKEDSDAQ